MYAIRSYYGVVGLQDIAEHGLDYLGNVGALEIESDVTFGYARRLAPSCLLVID